MSARRQRLAVRRAVRVALGLLGASLACTGVHDARAAWPPAPGADLTDPANWPNDPDYAGYWNFFSYLPEQAAGTAPYLSADKKLGASGMSIDKAWETTIGSPEVKIAIVDSGVEWDKADIINKAWLNAAELANHKPHHADGTACAGTGALAGFDCDGDGVLTVADYAADPSITALASDMCTSWSTGATSPRMKGDMNYNCVLDAGDLIQLYSDGKDDDDNGYVDDISGWDFYKDDNNPYDDVRYGHGTGEAGDSVSEANNGIDGLGACPLCRFVLLRAGNSFFGGVNPFAKAAVYAADNGFNVIQEAFATANLSLFARAAIDYAYAKNTILVSTMSDLNSRNHNMPTVANHAFPVHAIAYDGQNQTTSTTFVDFVNCTNYGGHLDMSVSGTACSSEATGKTSGISGLLYSQALAQNLSPSLTAEEVMQLQKMTADVINVPQSRVPGQTLYYESLPGFSQRFGYGRTNVANAVAALKSGLIPPEVEIISPGWYDTLYSDRTTGAVPIVGRVVAARAVSYDYTVEWGAGVEPADSEFKPLGATVSNVPGTTTSGGEASPLAMIDPSMIDTAHTPDPDSPHHENDRTVTLRVQVTAHYAHGDAKGEARRTIAIVNKMNGLDEDLLPGFPLKIGASVEGGAKLADIDGDGVRDIVLPTNDGSVHVFSLKGGTPAEVHGFPYLLRPMDGLDPHPQLASLPSYLKAPAYAKGAAGGIDPAITRESIDGSAAVGDVNGDGKPDIVFTSWEGTVYAVDATGKDLPGWPQRLPQVPSCPQDHSAPPPGACMDLLHDVTRGAFASPVLASFGGGKLSVVVAAFDGNLYVFDDDGKAHAGFPVAIHSPLAYKTDHILTTPAAGDLNGDGVPDFVVGSNETIGNQGSIGFYFVVDGRGTAAPGGPYLPHWPLQVPSQYTLPVVGEGTSSSPVLVDLEAKGVSDALLPGNGQVALVVPPDPGPQTGANAPASQLPQRPASAGGNGFSNGGSPGALSNETIPDDFMLPIFSHPSVGDLDQDGFPDLVQAGADLALAGSISGNGAMPFEHLLGMWNGKTGAQMPGSPYVLEDYSVLTNQAIADISGDDYPEVMQGTGGYFVHAVDACGKEPAGWPKFTDGWITATPAVGDITGDHGLEVVTATRDGFLYAWKTKGTDTGVIAWESAHHDNYNSGNYGTKLDQGVLLKAKTPLDCSAPDAGAPDASTRDSGARDAGARDGGRQRGDAAADGSVRGDASKPETDAGGTPSASGGGCRCTVGRSAETAGAWLGVGALGLVVARRRRRR